MRCVCDQGDRTVNGPWPTITNSGSFVAKGAMLVDGPEQRMVCQVVHIERFCGKQVLKPKQLVFCG
jgi:hypothetical protein